MKTAKEMFEVLGYEQTTNNKDYLEFVNYSEDETGTCYKTICFIKESKVFYCDDHYCSMYVDVETYKAIHQQLKELGWLDENFDNPPLNFEEIKPGMWVWVNDMKIYRQVHRTYVREVDDFGIEIEMVQVGGLHLGFEENRFYRKEVKDE